MPRRNSGFTLADGQSAHDGDRFELLVYDMATKQLKQSGRFGKVINILQDGDADVTMDDGNPPHMIKWRQILRVAG
jgi:hypothetical protein